MTRPSDDASLSRDDAGDRLLPTVRSASANVGFERCGRGGLAACASASVGFERCVGVGAAGVADDDEDEVGAF